MSKHFHYFYIIFSCNLYLDIMESIFHRNNANIKKRPKISQITRKLDFFCRMKRFCDSKVQIENVNENRTQSSQIKYKNKQEFCFRQLESDLHGTLGRIQLLFTEM